MRHSSIPLFEALGISHDQMRVQVTVGVADPDRWILPPCRRRLPRGRATVSAAHGGLNITNPDTGDVTVIATAAVEAFLPQQSGPVRTA